MGSEIFRAERLALGLSVGVAGPASLKVRNREGKNYEILVY